MKIYDYRTQTIRDLSEEKLFFLAPEMYIKVEVDNSQHEVYCYTYKIKGTNDYIYWYFHRLEMELCRLSFKELLSNFLKAHNLNAANVELVDKILYLNETAYDEYLEECDK